MLLIFLIMSLIRKVMLCKNIDCLTVFNVWMSHWHCFLDVAFSRVLFIQTFRYSCTIYLHSSFVIYVTFCICLDLIDTLYYQIWVLIRQREVRLAQLKRNHLAPRKWINTSNKRLSSIPPVLIENKTLQNTTTIC